MNASIRKLYIGVSAFILTVCLLLASVFGAISTTPTTTFADTVVYKTGANSASDSYRNGRYYKNLMQVNLYKDDVLVEEFTPANRTNPFVADLKLIVFLSVSL